MAGIVTDGTKVAPEQVGFTYEQYVSFVQEQFGGAEKITEFISRMHFLLGQKDLDTVIATINNRAQNVFSER